MEKRNVDYSQGKIYKLVSDSTGEVYFGSTTGPLAVRYAEHILCYLKHSYGISKIYVSSSRIIMTEEYHIELVENFPCESKKELSKREGYYIKTFPCVNMRVAGRTKKEYLEDPVVRDKVRENYNKFISNPENKELVKKRSRERMRLIRAQKKIEINL